MNADHHQGLLADFSKPAARKLMHRRFIESQGFRRDDGLWDIEARIVDSKPFAYQEPYRGHREAESDVHNIAIRLTLDDDFVVHDIEVLMPAVPYPSCACAIPNFKQLIGARVGVGWRKAVSAVVGSTKGCTHARELLFPMATVAFQTLFGWEDEAQTDEEKRRRSERDASRGDQSGRPHFLDGCHSWASDGEVVATLYPQFSTRKKV
ncbi:MAG: DUF2889 domain-containing protein [Betaproteobacteria bacterium]|nr:DUF2889 domain-containing protein [Betaproteobacteria bacterium]